MLAKKVKRRRFLPHPEGWSWFKASITDFAH
jgi:hypothetical protein